MRFLAFTWGTPLLAIVALMLLDKDVSDGFPYNAVNMSASFWIFANFPITFCYVLARVIWRAKRDVA